MGVIKRMDIPVVPNRNKRFRVLFIHLRLGWVILECRRGGGGRITRVLRSDDP